MSQRKSKVELFSSKLPEHMRALEYSDENKKYLVFCSHCGWKYYLNTTMVKNHSVNPCFVCCGRNINLESFDYILNKKGFSRIGVYEYSNKYVKITCKCSSLKPFWYMPNDIVKVNNGLPRCSHCHENTLLEDS